MTIDEANELIAALSTELRALDDVIREEKKAVDAKYSDNRREILRKQDDAEQALQDAKTAAVVPHQYEGEKVFRQAYRHPWEHPKDPIFGVIQTYTPGAELPSNTPNYDKPMIGEVIIRLLKKNGEPGIKIERYRRGGRWMLVRDPSIMVQS